MLQETKQTPTSFPGSFVFPQEGVVEENFTTSLCKSPYIQKVKIMFKYYSIAAIIIIIIIKILHWGIKYFLCLLSHLSSSTSSRVAKGSDDMTGKESWILLGCGLNGFRMRRSNWTLLSSAAADLWVWEDAKGAALFIWVSKFSITFRCPPAARLAFIMAFSVYWHSFPLSFSLHPCFCFPEANQFQYFCLHHPSS